jgi:hypothetical protein
MTRTEQRLHRAVDPRLEPGETFLAWSSAWVSRERRYQLLFGSRNRDFAIVTERRLLLWSAGFFTRRPRRRVLAERLDELTIESISRDPGRKIACRRGGRRALLLELGRSDRADKFALELLDRAKAAGGTVRRAAAPEAVDAPEDDTETGAEVAATPSPPDAAVDSPEATEPDGAPAESSG